MNNCDFASTYMTTARELLLLRLRCCHRTTTTTIATTRVRQPELLEGQRRLLNSYTTCTVTYVYDYLHTDCYHAFRLRRRLRWTVATKTVSTSTNLRRLLLSNRTRLDTTTTTTTTTTPTATTICINVSTTSTITICIITGTASTCRFEHFSCDAQSYTVGNSLAAMPVPSATRLDGRN